MPKMHLAFLSGILAVGSGAGNSKQAKIKSERTFGMNTAKISQEMKIVEVCTDKQGRDAATTEKELSVMNAVFTVSQRAAICFAAGVIGALAVVLFSQILFGLGLSAALGVKGPGLLEIAGHIQAALLGRTMGDPVWAVC